MSISGFLLTTIYFYSLNYSTFEDKAPGGVVLFLGLISVPWLVHAEDQIIRDKIFIQSTFLHWPGAIDNRLIDH